MINCSCLESAKTLLTTGKWEGGSCECCKKVPPFTLVLVAGLVGLLPAGLLGSLVARRRD